MKKLIITLIVSITLSAALFAQDVSVVLKNSKVVVGQIVEEKPDYLILDNDIGQIKIYRQNIESISYNPYVKLYGEHQSEQNNLAKMDSTRNYLFSIKDPVVIYYKDGNVVSGLLLAKSLNMVILQTDAGILTIPKRDLLKIEYVSSEYAERGEVVIVKLNNGLSFEGNIYFENSDELTLDTELGRLTLPKSKLRSIEYTGETGVSNLTMAEQYTNLKIDKSFIFPRYDVIDVGYTSNFGALYGPGFGVGYQSRFSLAQYQGVNLSAIGGLSLNYFALAKDNILNENPNLNATLKGGSFITTIGAGAQANIYPQTASFYDFYIAPMLEGHLIYKSLTQEYSVFPQFNTSEKKTEFKFGIGLRFGVEFLFDSFGVGLHYNLHYIFGTDGFNQISVTFVKPLF